LTFLLRISGLTQLPPGLFGNLQFGRLYLSLERLEDFSQTPPFLFGKTSVFS